MMNSAGNFASRWKFAMIAKFRYVAKILLLAKVSAPCFCVQTTPFLVFLISTLVIAFSFRFFFVISLALSLI